MTARSPSPRQAIAVAGLHVWGLTLLALHIYARTLPPTPVPIPPPDSAEAAWWGLWPAAYVPAPWFWAGCALVVATMIWGWRQLHTSWRSDPVIPIRPPVIPRRSRGIPLGSSLDQRDSSSQTGALWARNDRATYRVNSAGQIVLAGLLLLGFFAFPIVHTRWGDAYLLSRALAWPDPALRLTHSWQAPLDVWLHSRVWLALGPRLGWTDAVPVYRLLSPLAGAGFLAVLLAWSRDRDFAPGWLVFGLTASLGLLQLFFGYIENYSFAAAGILLFLWLGYRAAMGRAPLWQASLALAVTNATHPSTVVLAPALLYLGWTVARRGTITYRRAVVEIAVPMLLVATATVLLMEAGGHGLAALLTTDRPGGSDARWFVPLWTTSTRWEAYTLVSWLHARDLLNQMLLVAPVVLPALLWLFAIGGYAVHEVAAQPHRSEASPSFAVFLAVAALSYLALILVWNPDYGGQRDWDLFSLAWIPMTLWLTGLAARRLAALTAGFAPLLVLQALHTAAWVYQNTLPWSWP